MDKESKRFLSYLKKMYEDVKQEMKTKSLSYVGVKAYINHIPRNREVLNTDEDWDNEVYELSKIFLDELYNYSKEMGYIKDMPIEEFVKQ